MFIIESVSGKFVSDYDTDEDCTFISYNENVDEALKFNSRTSAANVITDMEWEGIEIDDLDVVEYKE